MQHESGEPYELNSDELREERTLADPADEMSWLDRLKRGFADRRWLVPLLFFVLSAGIYAGFAADRVTGPSTDPHFAYLANTFNSMLMAPFDEEAAQRRKGKKRFELDRRPPHRNDWASYWELKLEDDPKTYRGIWLNEQGHGRFKALDDNVYFIERGHIQSKKRRFFMSFPPAPAVLMMPLAAVWGYQVNDVVFTLFFAALNVMLMFVLLRRLSEGGRSGRGRRENIWLTLLFAFGTAHLWCSVLGQVWFTALIMGVTFTLLYAYFAIDARHPFLAGLALALGFATRTPLVFASIFFFAFVFFPGGKFRRDDWGEAAGKLAWFCGPCLAVGLTLLWMNHVRFGSLTEFGHTYLAAGSIERIQTYGLFNYHFLSKNLTAMLTLLPRLQPEPPYIIVSTHGMSIFLTTPALFYLFRPRERQGRADTFWWRLLWATVAACAIPALFYQNTGYAQFGYRFILDYLPYLVVLLAVGRHRLTWVFKTCVIAAFLVNGFGAVTFKRMGQFYRDGFFF